MIQLSGFTFLRNALELGYPWVEACMSVLPLCDEFVIGVATDSTDDTAKWVKKVQQRWPEKIRIYEFQWPSITATGTSIGTVQTDVLRQCKGWYRWLIQADEIYAPETLPVVQQLVKEAKYEAYGFPFQHIQSNFQQIIPLHTAAYTRAVRLVRNIDRIIAEHDGWSLLGYQSLYNVDTKPISHVGYEFIENIVAKWANHAKLYADLEEYQALAQEWQDKLDSGNIGPEFEKTDSPFDLPPILHGLIGLRRYAVRPDLLTNPGKYVAGL